MYRSFYELLSKAINGDSAALTEIFDIYLPLINRHSKIDGYADEDCRQYIMMRAIDEIAKFVI